MTTDHDNNKYLFKQISQGDERAFQTVFHIYNRLLFPFILSVVKSEEDAKEIIQDVFLKLWLRRESLILIENPGGWLHTVAANSAYSYLRKEARYTMQQRKVAVISGENLEDIHEQIDVKEVKALIAEAVDKLPQRRRQIFRLSRFEGYSRKEIAELMEISENTVRNQLVEAVSFIQNYVQKHGLVYIPAILFLAELVQHK